MPYHQSKKDTLYTAYLFDKRWVQMLLHTTHLILIKWSMT